MQAKKLLNSSSAFLKLYIVLSMKFGYIKESIKYWYRFEKYMYTLNETFLYIRNR